jgi:hypothetical protein
MSLHRQLVGFEAEIDAFIAVLEERLRRARRRRPHAERPSPQAGIGPDFPYFPFGGDPLIVGWSGQYGEIPFGARLT